MLRSWGGGGGGGGGQPHSLHVGCSYASCTTVCGQLSTACVSVCAVLSYTLACSSFAVAFFGARHYCTVYCKAINFCGAHSSHFQELCSFTTRNFCDVISSVGSCTVCSQCAEQCATIYIRECVMAAKIAKYNLSRKFLSLQYVLFGRDLQQYGALVLVQQYGALVLVQHIQDCAHRKKRRRGDGCLRIAMNRTS